MNKLRAYFRVICAPIRPSIFRHSRQANSVFPARKFEPVARNFVPAQNFDLSTWVTMSAMPPIDNYISQAWEWIAMKKNVNILQGWISRKILMQKDSFGGFWYILINYNNDYRTQKKRKSVKKLKTLMPD